MEEEQLQLDFTAKVPLMTMVRNSDPDTSEQAAVAARKKVNKNMRLALRSLAASAMTDWELARATGMERDSIGKRRTDLVRLGLVREMTVDGVGVRRMSPRGCMCKVWEVTEEGHEELGTWPL